MTTVGSRLARFLPERLMAGIARAVRGYGSTLVTEMIIVGGTLLIFREVAKSLGTAGFAEYQLARATLTSAEPVLLSGLMVALPRFVARAVAARGGLGAEYLRAATWLCLAMIAVVVPVGVLFRAQLAVVFLGDPSAAGVMVAVLVAAVGIICGGLSYGYLRGRHRGRAANCLRIANLFVAPVVAVFTTSSVFWLMTVYGGLVILFSLGFLVWIWPRRQPRGTEGRGRQMLSYAFRRVPGDLCSAALLTIPTIFAAHLVDVSGAGFVGFGTSVIALVVAFMAPLNYVLVPYLSREIGAGRGWTAYRNTRLLPAGCAAVAAVIVGLLSLLMDTLVRIYLGPGFEGAAHAARVIAVSSIPLAAFFGSRSIIDSFYDSARNARNLIFAVSVEVVVTLVLAPLTTGLSAVAAGLFAASSVLAATTLLSQVRIKNLAGVPEPPQQLGGRSGAGGRLAMARRARHRKNDGRAPSDAVVAGEEAHASGEGSSGRARSGWPAHRGARGVHDHE